MNSCPQLVFGYRLGLLPVLLLCHFVLGFLVDFYLEYHLWHVAIRSLPKSSIAFAIHFMRNIRKKCNLRCSVTCMASPHRPELHTEVLSWCCTCEISLFSDFKCTGLSQNPVYLVRNFELKSRIPCSCFSVSTRKLNLDFWGSILFIIELCQH